MAFLVNGNPIITDDRDLSAVGVATLTEDINIGRLLYDSTGQVGAANSVLVTKDNTLQWVAPSAIGISTGSSLAPGSTYFVTENGSDSNTGDSVNNAWATVGHALTSITVSGDDVLYISAGDYEETFPLAVPAGLTIKGAGQRATTIRPSAATETENGFLLNNDTTVEDLTVADMFKGAGANSYAFAYESGAEITTRGPYISRVSVINRGSVTSASDPYGYGSADNYPIQAIGAGGILADGSVLGAATVTPSILLNEVTLFPVKNNGIELKNGTRCEALNSFVYFAEEGIKGESDLANGLAGAGRARLTLDNPSATPQVGNTIEYYDTDGTTVAASGTIDEVSGNYVYLTDAGTGLFEVPRNNTAVPVNFVGGAEITNAQVKYGSGSLDVTSTNSDAVTAEDTGFGFGTGDFTVEGWFYFTGLTSNRFVWDFRGTAATDSRLALEELGGGDVAVNIGTTQILLTTGGPLSTNTWHHIAVARTSGNMAIFVDGTQEDIAADATDLGLSGTLHLGADYTDSNGMTGYIDDYRVEKGVAKYTGAFTAPTAALTADKDTSILLHFDGNPGDTTTADDIIVTQDIRFTGGNTADKTTLADYQQFGADLRSIGCAVEYGNKGVVGDGQGVSLRLFAINFNYVGSGGDFTNDPNLSVQANEVTELNDASVYYVSVDQGGDFRVGDAFFVDQETGEISFSSEVTDLTSLSSLTITDGTNSSLITPTSGRFGNVQISGNQIESTTGDLNLKTAGAGDVNVDANLNVVGVISASGVNLASIQNGDTSIALDDTGSDGTIRFITDGSEAGRFDNSNDLTVTNDIAAQNVGAASTVSAAFFEGDGSKLTNLSASNVDLTGTYQSLAGVAVTGPGVALTVTNNAEIGGTLSVTGVTTLGNADIDTVSVGTAATIPLLNITDSIVGVVTFAGNIDAEADITVDGKVSVAGTVGVAQTASFATDIVVTGKTVGFGSAFFGDILANSLDLATGDLTGDGNTNISGIQTVTAAFFEGDGSKLTNISSSSVDLTGTDQSLNSLVVTGPGIALTVTNDVAIGGSMAVNTIYAQNYDSLSDRELKDNIEVINDALVKLEGVNGVSYTWKNNGRDSFGVIAQEVQATMPELVTEGENLTVNYNGLVGVLIRAVKELNEKVEDLQRQLDEK